MIESKKKSIFLKSVFIVFCLYLLVEYINYSIDSKISKLVIINPVTQSPLANPSTTTSTTTTTTSTTQRSVIRVNLFDLSAPLEPKSAYENIPCKKSANIHVSTTLCVHDLNSDVHVSGSIWREGVWEPHIVRPFVDYLVNNPEWLVLDVGAQIGQYSLFAAKLGRDVVCVEPFHDNILRIHKATYTEKTFDKITLIKNAISNKRFEIKRLQPERENIGGQSLLQHKDKIYDKDKMNDDKYLVETILFDDIIDSLPKNKDGNDYKKAILKIDIEGFEPYAFRNASKLFDRLDIRVIYMEWGNLPKQFDNHDLIIDMIRFLRDRNYRPNGDNRDLMDSDWKRWPWDIIWFKD